MQFVIKTLSLLALGLVLMASCGSPPPVTNKGTPVPSPTPIPPEAVRINKPVNVSFSTYSKDWPVGWQWIDPDEKYHPTPHDVKTGVLRITVPNEKDLYGGNRTAPRYVKPITGDFQIETRVKFLPKENYQGAGLLIYKDENNYMRFERAYGGSGGGTDGIRIDVRTLADYKSIVTPADVPTEAEEIELKIIRTGRAFTAFWREDENAEWRLAGEYASDYPETILAGLIVCNTAREVTAEFKYIRLLPVTKPNS